MKLYLLVLAIFFVLEQVISENAYRILGLAPYYSMQEVKKTCKKLAKIYHPDKYKGDKEEARSKFDRFQKACKEIKDSRLEEKEDESGFKVALKRCLGYIAISVLAIFIGYYFSMFLFKFFNYIFKFSIVSVTTFFIIDCFLAHYFESEEEQFGYSLLLAILIISLGSIKNYFLGKIMGS